MAKLHLFYGWVVLHYLYAHHIFFIHSPVDGHKLLPYPSCCKWCYYKHLSTCIFWIRVWGFFWLYTHEWNSHTIVVFLVFWEASILFFTIATLIYSSHQQYVRVHCLLCRGVLSCSVVIDSLWPHGLCDPTRLLLPWGFSRFHHILANSCYLFFLMIAILVGIWCLISHYGFDLHFPGD